MNSAHIKSVNENARATREATEARYAAWAGARGYRPSPAAPCPRLVSGRQQCCGSANVRCVCHKFMATGVLDHLRLWLTADGYHVTTAEPYVPPATDSRIAELRWTCAALGLDVEISVSDDSPYYPGYTRLILIEPNAAARQRLARRVTNVQSAPLSKVTTDG